MMAFLLKIITFFSPIQSFVVTNVIKGLTIFNVGILIRFFSGLFFVNKSKSKLIYHLSFFLFIYLGIVLLQQFSINLFPLKYFKEGIFVSGEASTSMLLRSSLFTQSIYLFICILFFDYIINYLFKNNFSNFINLIFFSILTFVFYGYFEFFFYLFTGNNSDFISNRITGEDFAYGLFQTVSISGNSIMRIKSLAGESSMFAFTILPFFIFSIYLRKRLIAIFLLVTLLLTTSTSAILGILTFVFLDLIYFKRRVIKIVILSILLLIFYWIFYDVINQLYLLVYDKINLVSASGIDRFRFFNNHLQIWLDSNIIHKIFGYGFGYFRSTDGFSTLLVNVGVFGLLSYCSFFILPYFLISRKSRYIRGLYIANLTLLIVILISVSEFCYPHIWIFNALLWYEYFRNLNRNKNIEDEV